MCSGKAFLHKGRALIVLEEYEEAMRALETGLNFALQDPDLISEVSRLRGIMGNRSARVAPGRAADPDSRGAPAAKRRAQDDRIAMAAEEQAARQNTTGERDTAGVARMSGAEPTEREQRAVANYERHHQLTQGTVTLTQVKESAEGVSGWASRSVDAAGPAAAPPPVGSPAGGAPATLPEEEFTCPLCAKLLFEPVTTSCGAPFLHTTVQNNQTLTKKITDGICAGHSFCRGCLLRALDHMNRCPVCRTILHTRSAPNPIPFQDFFSIFSRFACLVRSAQNHPISTSLQSVLSKHFAAQTAERAKEDKEDVKSQPTVLPLFITDFVLPGQVRYLACPDPHIA